MVATYTKPTSIPRWADTSTNILEPPELKKDEGWLFEEIPPSAFENWRTNLIGSWAKWLDERLFDGASADEFLIKCPKDGTDGLLIADTFVKSMKDFRVEGDDLGVEVDGVTSRRIYFDSAKQNWLGYSIGGSRMELYAGGALAIYADATGTYINGDLNIGDDLSLPGGLAVGIATPAIIDDVIQLGDANNKWDFNSGNPRLYCDTNDFLTYERSNELFYFYINNTKKLRIAGAGISADGIYAGDVATNPTDNCVTAALHGLFGGGVSVGVGPGLVPPTGSITLGDSDLLLRYNATLPYLQFAAGDQLAYDRTNDLFQFKIGTTEELRLSALGLSVGKGLQVGFIGTPTNDRIEIGDVNFNLDFNSGNPSFVFDTNDMLQYNRAGNYWRWIVGSTEYLRLTSVGELTWITPRTSTTTTKGAIEMDGYTGKLVGGDGTNGIRYVGQAASVGGANLSAPGNFASLTLPANTLRNKSTIRIRGVIHASYSGLVLVNINGSQVAFVNVGVGGAAGQAAFQADTVVTADPGASVATSTGYSFVDTPGFSSPYIGNTSLNVATNANVTLTVAWGATTGAGTATMDSLTIDLT